MIPVIAKLRESIDQLELSIQQSRIKINDPTILAHLDQYNKIVEKQRDLTNNLQVLVTEPQKNLNEIARVVRVINGLSEMIKQDANDILGQLQRGAAQ